MHRIQFRGRAAIACGALVSTLQAPAFAAGPEDGTLEEVVVTATRQSDTVNHVPLAVTAQTQRDLDQQGVQTIADLHDASTRTQAVGPRSIRQCDRGDPWHPSANRNGRHHGLLP